MQRPDHAEARPGVKTGPLARRAHAEEKTGEREVARPSLRRRGGERVPALREEPAVHEVIHRQREEYAVGVDRGDARLDKVHEIGGEQQRAADGYAAPSEEPPGKGVDERQHRHTEERPGKAPAEGRYAPNRHAQRDQQLAQRGMRDLIGVHAAHMLKSRASVVDLVKIARVEERAFCRHKTLLVGQLAHGPPGEGRAVSAKERKLAQLRRAVGGQPHKARPAGEGQLVPLYERDIILLELADVGKALAVLRQGNRIAARADHAVRHRAGEIIRAAKLKRHALALAEGDGALRRGHAAEMGKGGDGIEQRDEHDGERLAARFSAAFAHAALWQRAASKRRQQAEKARDQQRGQNRENGSQFHVILSVQR